MLAAFLVELPLRLPHLRNPRRRVLTLSMRNYSVSTAAATPRVPAAPQVGPSRERDAEHVEGGPVSSVFVVQTNARPRAKVGGVDDPSVRWAGAFAAYGGHGTTASSTIVYEIEPGGPLGWHTDPTEETQYILAGTGELRMEDGSKYKVRPGSVFVIPTPVRHDLANTGSETLRAVAFFAAAMFTQQFDNVMLPPDVHLLGTPNRTG